MTTTVFRYASVVTNPRSRTASTTYKQYVENQTKDNTYTQDNTGSPNCTYKNETTATVTGPKPAKSQMAKYG